MSAGALHISRNSVWLALLLAGWGAVKVGWEQALGNSSVAVHEPGLRMTPEVRDQIGQGMMIALLSGFRGVTADFTWLAVCTAWQDQEWFRVKSRIDLATTLQPRSTLFWEMGSWYLAWNAATDRRNNRNEPLELRRIKEERYWINAGRDLLLRGVENNPDSYKLWRQLAFLYELRLKDYREAAKYYQIACEQPGAPLFLYRFVGYDLEKAGADQEAYDYWKSLWLRPGPKTDPLWRWDKIEEKIRVLEKKLSIPREKRIFPD